MKELLTKMKDLISQPIPVKKNILDTASDNKIMNQFDCYRYGITMAFPIRAEEKVNLLADYLSVNPDIKILNIHDYKSGGNYDKIISTLAGCQYLTQLQIGYRGALFVGDQALAALAHHKSLTFLGLPALMDKKSNLAILEKNTRLKTLKLLGDDESVDPGEFDEKVRILSNYSSVENFHFRACIMNAKAINYFSSNRGLKYLNLEGSNVGDEVTVILSTHPTLTRLNLSFCGISNVGVAFLMKNHVLRDLNLGENVAISNKGAGLLSTHPSLTKLNLRACKITDKGAGFLMNNHVLRDLSLQFTYVHDEGACLLSKHPTLTSLNLTDCGVSLKGAAYFLQNTVLRSLNLSRLLFLPTSDLDIVGNCLAGFFLNHPTLTRLSLKRCLIGDKGAIELASNTRLTWLNLMDNPIGFLGAIALALNESLKTLKVSIPDEKQLGWLFLLGNQNLESLTIKYPKNHHPGHHTYRFCSAVRHHQGLNQLTIRNASRQMEQDQKFKKVLLEYLPIPDVLTGIVFDYTKKGYPYDYGLFCRSLTPKIKKRINKELPQVRESLNRFASAQI